MISSPICERVGIRFSEEVPYVNIELVDSEVMRGGYVTFSFNGSSIGLWNYNGSDASSVIRDDSTWPLLFPPLLHGLPTVASKKPVAESADSRVGPPIWHVYCGQRPTSL